jgi:ADP-ribose pyrophosphatase
MTEPWIKLNEKSLQLGRRKLLHRTYRLPDGSVDDFDIKHEPQVVCILALTTDRQVVLARQFRPGPEQILLEMPGGGMEADETPQQAAARELLEETGYAGEIQYIGTSLDCAYTTLLRHNFVATGCQKLQEPQTGAGEFTEAVTMSLADFRQHLRSGQLTDIETGYLGLDYLGLL